VVCTYSRILPIPQRKTSIAPLAIPWAIGSPAPGRDKNTRVDDKVDLITGIDAENDHESISGS